MSFLQNNKVVKCPWNSVVILADKSGSTNNARGRSRGRFQVNAHRSDAHRSDAHRSDAHRSDEPRLDEIEDETTKIIHLAIDDALSIVLGMLSEKYDMADVKLKLAPFSTSCKVKINKELSSNEELYNLSKALHSVKDMSTRQWVPGELFSDEDRKFGSTDLTLALRTVFTDDNNDNDKSVLFILASDGRPDNCETTLATFDNIISRFKNFDMFSIGAGSITDSANGTNSRVSMRGDNTVRQTNEQLLSRMQGSSECDQEFLLALSEKARVGGYAGAYRRYEGLISGFNNFLNNIKTWKVKLDNGYAELNANEQTLMNNLKLENKPSFAVTYRQDMGWYVLFCNGNESYQLAVNPFGDYPVNVKGTICELQNFNPTPGHENDFYKFETLFVRVLPKTHTQVKFAVLESGNEKYFSPDIINHGTEFRVRKLTQF